MYLDSEYHKILNTLFQLNIHFNLKKKSINFNIIIMNNTKSNL